MTLTTLKRRAEFLRLRGGARWGTPSFVLETRPRAADEGVPEFGTSTTGARAAPQPDIASASQGAGSSPTDKPSPDRTMATIDGPRFGFTVTRQVGNAVTRNRIRRRLRELVRLLAPLHARPRQDYVLIARAAAATRDFADLKKELEQAFQRVHHPRAEKPRPRTTRGRGSV